MKRALRASAGAAIVLAMGCMVAKEHVCAVDGDCATGNECVEGACQTRACTSDDACAVPGAAPECEAHHCKSGVCQHSFTPAGPLPEAQQTAGDCAQRSCDGSGHLTTTPDMTDLPPASGMACTEAVCTGSGPDHVTAPLGTSCANGVCDASGTCVECVAATDCMVGTAPRCLDSHCVSCSNGAQDGDETGVDCGGACTLQCVLGACTADADCKEGACDAAQCRWDNGHTCTSSAQCTSHHCAGTTGQQTCQACTTSVNPCTNGACVNGVCPM